MNFFDATFSEGDVHIDGKYRVPCHSDLPSEPRTIRLGVRPEDVQLGKDGVDGMIERRVQHGHYDEVLVCCVFGSVRAVIPSYLYESEIVPGNTTRVSFKRILAYRDGTLLTPAEEQELTDLAR
jgi:hypothetical protein